MYHIFSAMKNTSSYPFNSPLRYTFQTHIKGFGFVLGIFVCRFVLLFFFLTALSSLLLIWVWFLFWSCSFFKLLSFHAALVPSNKNNPVFLNPYSSIITCVLALWGRISNCLYTQFLQTFTAPWHKLSNISSSSIFFDIKTQLKTSLNLNTRKEIQHHKKGHRVYNAPFVIQGKHLHVAFAHLYIKIGVKAMTVPIATGKELPP